jgi:hypothetical protein
MYVSSISKALDVVRYPISHQGMLAQRLGLLLLQLFLPQSTGHRLYLELVI